MLLTSRLSRIFQCLCQFNSQWEGEQPCTEFPNQNHFHIFRVFPSFGLFTSDFDPFWQWQVSRTTFIHRSLPIFLHNLMKIYRNNWELTMERQQCPVMIFFSGHFPSKQTYFTFMKIVIDATHFFLFLRMVRIFPIFRLKIFFFSKLNSCKNCGKSFVWLWKDLMSLPSGNMFYGWKIWIEVKWEKKKAVVPETGNKDGCPY